MCGRFTLALTPEELAEAFDLIDVPDDAGPRYNIAPTQQVAAITSEAPEIAQMLKWGLIPSWAKDPSMGAKLINARAETVASKPSFRSAYERRRCLILADGFYEWKREGTARRPHRIRLGTGAPLTFAGLWESWQSPAGPQVRTCTIITTTANELVEEVHTRMPVIVSPDDRGTWLEEDGGGRESARLLRPYPAEEMVLEPVGTRVNSVHNDDPSCLVPVQMELPAQGELW